MSSRAAQADASPPPENRGWFATTQWNVVLSTHARNPERARNALQELCNLYWYPLYAYLRRRGHQPADAEDLVQAFIEHLLENHFFQAANPHKGRFRSYLLTSLSHFLSDTFHRSGRQKRGGKTPPLSLDAPQAEQRYSLEPLDPHDPEELFERRWALTLLDTVLKRLEAETAEMGRLDVFRQLKDVLLGDRAGTCNAELGRQLGMSEAAVRMVIHRLRHRYRELVHEAIAHTVSHPGEIEEELRHLFQVLSR